MACGLRRRSAGDRFLGLLGSNSAEGMAILLLGLLCVLYEAASATADHTFSVLPGMCLCVSVSVCV